MLNDMLKPRKLKRVTKAEEVISEFEYIIRIKNRNIIWLAKLFNVFNFFSIAYSQPALQYRSSSDFTNIWLPFSIAY